jgi:hypothetical protein
MWGVEDHSGLGKAASRTAGFSEDWAKVPTDPHDTSQCVSTKDNPTYCKWHKSDHLETNGEPRGDVDGHGNPVEFAEVPRCDLCDGFHDTLSHYHHTEPEVGAGRPEDASALDGIPMEGSRRTADRFAEDQPCHCGEPGHTNSEHADWAEARHAEGTHDAWGRPLMQPYDGHGAWSCNNYDCVQHPKEMYQERQQGMPGWLQEDLKPPEQKAVEREVGRHLHEAEPEGGWLLGQQPEGPSKYSLLQHFSDVVSFPQPERKMGTDPHLFAGPEGGVCRECGWGPTLYHHSPRQVEYWHSDQRQADEARQRAQWEAEARGYGSNDPSTIRWVQEHGLRGCEHPAHRPPGENIYKDNPHFVPATRLGRGGHPVCDEHAGAFGHLRTTEEILRRDAESRARGETDEQRYQNWVADNRRRTRMRPVSSLVQHFAGSDPSHPHNHLHAGEDSERCERCGFGDYDHPHLYRTKNGLLRGCETCKGSPSGRAEDVYYHLHDPGKYEVLQRNQGRPHYQAPKSWFGSDPIPEGLQEQMEGIGEDASWLLKQQGEGPSKYSSLTEHFAARDQETCPHDGGWNLHGQCKQCGYTAFTDADDECDDPYCQENNFPEGWHTKGEHVDPAHLDPHSDESRGFAKQMEGLGGPDATWLLDQQSQGPTKYSARTGAVLPGAAHWCNDCGHVEGIRDKWATEHGSCPRCGSRNVGGAHDEPPTWDEHVQRLHGLEDQINEIGGGHGDWLLSHQPTGPTKWSSLTEAFQKMGIEHFPHEINMQTYTDPSELRTPGHYSGMADHLKNEHGLSTEDLQQAPGRPPARHPRAGGPGPVRGCPGHRRLHRRQPPAPARAPARRRPRQVRGRRPQAPDAGQVVRAQHRAGREVPDQAGAWRLHRPAGPQLPGSDHQPLPEEPT